MYSLGGLYSYTVYLHYLQAAMLKTESSGFKAEELELGELVGPLTLLQE